MKLTILGSGTSQGIPVIACECPVCHSTDNNDKRLRCSAMLEINGINIVFDAGPDFRYQMLRAGVKDIQAILLTHGHKDHTGGLDDVRAFNWIKQSPMYVYVDALTKKTILNDYAYAFAEHKYPGVPQIILKDVDYNPFYIEGIEIIPLRIMHYHLPITGYRIQNFAYITDANFISDETMAKLEGVEFLVLNALRKEPHLSHFTLNEALNVIARIKPKHAWLTHIGHQMGFAADVSKELPSNVSLAYDTMSIDF